MLWTMKQKIFWEKTYYETKFSKIFQLRYRRKFNFEEFLNRSNIFKLYKSFEAHETCEDRWATSSTPSWPLII